MYVVSVFISPLHANLIQLQMITLPFCLFHLLHDVVVVRHQTREMGWYTAVAQNTDPLCESIVLLFRFFHCFLLRMRCGNC
jgi:hypothetical protein